MDIKGYFLGYIFGLLLLVSFTAGQPRRGGTIDKIAAAIAGKRKDHMQKIQDALNNGDISSRTGYACEGSTLTISCDEGETLRILRANYGRLSMRPCHEGGTGIANWDLNCISTRALPVINEMCTGRDECWVLASNQLFGSDPCPLTPKYLEAEFTCEPAAGGEEGPRTRPPPPVIPETTTPTTTTTSTTTTTEATTTSTTTTTTTPMPPTTRLPDLGVKYCDQTWIRNVSWPNTMVGEMASEPCPNNEFALATWLCTDSTKVDWKGDWKGFPDLSKCVSPKLADMGKRVTDVEQILRDASMTQDEQLIRAKEAAAADIVEAVAADMIMVSHATAYGGDLDGIAKVMENMVQHIDVRTLNVTKPRAKDIVNKVNQAVVKSSSNLMDRNKKEAWQDLPQSNQAEAATRMINCVETSAFNVADMYDTPERRVTVDINIVLEINVISTMGPGTLSDVSFPNPSHLASQDNNWAGNGNTIRLTGKTIKEHGVDGLAKLIFATYNNIEEFLQQPQRDQSWDITTTTTVQPVEPSTEQLYRENKMVDVPIDYSAEHLYPENKMEDMEYYNMIQEVEIMEFEQKQQEKEEEQNKLADMKVATNIISASINGRKENVELSEPVVYVLEHKTQNNIYNPTCSFWEYEERSMNGHWSTFGCELVDSNVTHSTCSCNHMTNFAVLMDVHSIALTEQHNSILSWLTYIGCIISLVCLLMAILTFIFIRKLQCDRNTIHKNLSLCLFIAQLVFLAGIAQHEQKILCSVVAGVLHYFLLASFMWMFLEGLQLYIMLIEVFESEKSRRHYYYAFGYGIPAIIVAVSAGVFPKGYGTDLHCWLTTKAGFIWAFVGPVVVVLAVNLFMLGIAIFKMCQHSRNVSAWKMKEKSRFESARSWLKGAFVLVVLLGLTWVFGFLFYNGSGMAIFWAYIFVVMNSLQGCFIFLFHCLFNEKVQKEYKRIVRKTKWLPECIRVKYGGANKSYTSTPTTNNSSSGNALQKLWSGRFRKRSSTSSIINKSTSSTPGRWTYQGKDNSQSNGSNMPDSGVHLDANGGSAIYSEPTEDPGGYLDPVSIRVDSGLDYDMIHGGEEPMSNIEGSIVDTDYFDSFPRPGGAAAREPLINVDKYKIHALDTVPREVPPKRPISLVSEEKSGCEDSDSSDSDDDDISKEKAQAQKEFADDLPLMDEKTLSEKEDGDDDEVDETDTDTLDLKKKLHRLSSDSGNVDTSSSLNDLNKLDSDEGVNLPARNLNFRPQSTLKRDNREEESHSSNGSGVGVPAATSAKC